MGKDDLAEELSGQFEGDIILSAEQMKEYELGSKSKTGLIMSRYKWAGGVVPFRIIEKDFSKFQKNCNSSKNKIVFTAPEQIDYIKLGTKKMEAVTCMRFVPFDPKIHNDWVTVQGSSSGCFSSVGRRGIGEQILNLQPYNLETGCFRLYTIVHEFIHGYLKNVYPFFFYFNFLIFISCWILPYAVSNGTR